MSGRADGAASLAIVVPVYNEAENIEKLIRSMEKHVNVPHQVVIVHDRDDDNTLPVARMLQPEFPNIVLVKNCYGNGRGVVNALRTGLYGTCSDYVCVVCADGTDQTEAVMPMYALARQGYELVGGARYIRGGAKIGGPWLQTKLSKLGNNSFRTLTRFPISDSTYSFRLYSRRLLDAIRIEGEGGWSVSFELAVKAHLRGLRMAEIPTVWIDRQFGESRFRLAGWLPSYARWFFYGIWAINRRRWKDG